jgi:carbon-monoxide dehydrogenase medium subunit/6-hydroxypseudooxynicotine dehydrogenase subunit alpha
VRSPPFEYARAETLDHALELLDEAGEDAKPLAGGQSLLPVLAYRLVRPSHLVDIDRVPGLEAVDERDGVLELGALVRHAALERLPLQGAHALLPLAAARIGHVPIRTRGTLGGSLAHADPAAELPVAAVALDARIVVRSTHGEREVPAEEFFVGPFTTALAPGELVVSVGLPSAADGSSAGFREFAVRAGDFAVAAAGVTVTRDGAGTVTDARVVLGAVEPVPRRLREAEAALVGRALEATTAAEAARIAAETCEPIEDRNADEAMRRDLVTALVSGALEDAAA